MAIITDPLQDGITLYLEEEKTHEDMKYLLRSKVFESFDDFNECFTLLDIIKSDKEILKNFIENLGIHAKEHDLNYLCIREEISVLLYSNTEFIQLLTKSNPHNWKELLIQFKINSTKPLKERIV